MPSIIVVILVCFTCVSPALLAQTPPFEFHALSTTASYNPADGSGSFPAFLQIAEDPSRPGYPTEMQGFSISIAYEGPVQASSIDDIGVLQETNGGSGPDFIGANLDPPGGPGVTAGIVISMSGADVIAFPEALDVLEITFDPWPGVLVGDPEGSAIALTWMDGLGDPGVINAVVVSGVSHEVAFFDGEVTLEPLEVPFLRGDADGDGTVQGLLDGLFVLTFQFGGGPGPSCLDAADSDDDGVLNGLIDGLYLLGYQFLAGSPAPPLPFPECGEDPTPDTLFCAASCP